MASWGVESKLRSFIHYAIAKLDGANEELSDEDPEDNYAELATFTCGFSRHLKNVGASAPGSMKQQISQVLAPVWDLKTDQPGPDLTIPNLRSAMDELLASVLAEELPPDDPVEPEDEEIKPANIAQMTLQDAVTHMWNIDRESRVPWGEGGFTVNMQNKGGYGRDTCDDKLFDNVDFSHAFWSSPTTAAYVKLLDNYERETGKAERVTHEEKKEVAEFLDALCETKVFRFLLEYLRAHPSLLSGNRALHTMLDMQNLISDLWMAPYRRYRENDSSGFEHVFVGEEKRGKIIGMHNWVTYYLEEQKGNIDYLGWVGRQDSDYSDDVHLVTVKFAWEDDDSGPVEEKPMSTILCGSTVEFEMALLTLVFVTGNADGDNFFRLENADVNVKCHSQKVRIGPPKVGTAYIEIA
mmetsp:Transcript_28238/g.61817  ORF Transcript_28238/g.61817 Transcript_28238/m.61817 type:complete len:410 (+) Transcript_28238:106-1335(+)|eukprot:3105532-Pleurochrysis_carterae.AAC.4